MAREFRFTDPGEGIHEAEIVEVTVSPGDHVEDGDSVLIVETDKAETELPSPFTGEVQDIPVSSGDVVEVGDVLMTFSEDGEAGEDGDAADTAEAAEPSPRDEDEGGTEDAEDAGGKAAAVGELPTEEPAPTHRHAEAPEVSEDGHPVPAAPATRQLARERGVDLAQVEPSGPHGRVTRSDVEAAAEGAGAAEEHGRDGQERDGGERRREPERPSLPDFERWGPIERVPLRGIRRTTARRVAVSWREIPHVTHHELVDVTALERWRREHADQVKESGGALSLMVLMMKALAGVLPRYPRFNASLDVDANEIVLKHHHHLGIAVDTDDGLIVPVVRDVDRKPLLDLAIEVGELVTRVRDRDIDSDELAGGTFTITNVGPLGGAGFTPLIRHPEVAILGMGRARLEPVVVGDLDDHRFDVALQLPLSLAYDHRIADGADAARFVSDLADALADPGSLLLAS